MEEVNHLRNARSYIGLSNCNNAFWGQTYIFETLKIPSKSRGGGIEVRCNIPLWMSVYIVINIFSGLWLGPVIWIWRTWMLPARWSCPLQKLQCKESTSFNFSYDNRPLVSLWVPFIGCDIEYANMYSLFFFLKVFFLV